MHKNIPLVVGITFLFLGLAIQPSVATVQPEEEMNKESKPDFKVVKIDIENIRNYPTCYIDVQNCGMGPIPSGTDIEVQMTMKKLFKKEVVCSHFISKTCNKQINPNETIQELYLGNFCVGDLGVLYRYRIFFELDPNDKVDEQNEKNNVVWAYIIGFVLGVAEGGFWYLIIGKLRQKWIVDNIGITCFPS